MPATAPRSDVNTAPGVAPVTNIPGYGIAQPASPTPAQPAAGPPTNQLPPGIAPAANLLSPNQGTGFVDWSAYLNPNSQTIANDRGTVQNYLQGMENSIKGQVNYGNQGTPGITDQLDNLRTYTQALGTPAGFEQVLSKATGRPAGNSFDAALEGQNASSLYNTSGLDSYLAGLKAPGTPPPTARAGQPTTPNWTNPMGPDTQAGVGGGNQFTQYKPTVPRGGKYNPANQP